MVPSARFQCISRASRDGVFGALDVAIVANNLVRLTAKELGGNLRYVLSNIEYAEVCAVLTFLSRHLVFAGLIAKAPAGSEVPHQEKDAR